MTSETVTLARRYMLDKRIAGGGMGTVWQATDQVLARTVAVKILHPSLSDNEQFIQRFKREAFSAARLTHPNIVSIYDTGREAAFDDIVRYYIVMEYCARGTLANLLEREGSMDSPAACGLGGVVCGALGYAHSNGVVHRDIKPENVLVAEDGSLKVADFGIAKAAFALGDITTTGVILGTVTHISPEQAKGLEPDARSDLYALGVLLYQLLVGRPPFQAGSEIATAMQHIRDSPPPLRNFKANVPKAVEAVVLKALEKEPDDRYQTAEEMRSALERAGGRSPGASSSSTAVLEIPLGSGPEGSARRAAGREAGRARRGRRTSGSPDRGDRQAQASPDPASKSESRTANAPSTGSRSLIVVGLLVALAILAAVLIPALTDGQDRTRGNRDGGGSRSGGGSAEPIEITEIADFDPYGDTEHPEEAVFAGDGDSSTEWTTETYTSSLAALKPGVGLVFDLGRRQNVDRFELTTTTPGYDFELKEADAIAADETGFNEVVSRGSTESAISLDFQTTQARYWLVWITELPDGGGGSASISEVAFFGR